MLVQEEEIIRRFDQKRKGETKKNMEKRGARKQAEKLKSREMKEG